MLWAGLKGAVPILLGAFIVEAGTPGAERLYQIIFVVVAFSVMVQGGTVPWLLRRLRVPLRTIEPEPWSLGIRFQHEPEGLHRFVVAPGAAADATQVGDLPVNEDTWISFIIRDGRLVPIRPDTTLRAGDEAVVLSADPDAAGLPALFAGRRRTSAARRATAGRGAASSQASGQEGERGRLLRGEERVVMTARAEGPTAPAGSARASARTPG